MFFYSVFGENTVMSKFPLLSVLGIEIEYMLVDAENFDIKPKADLILQALGANGTWEVQLDETALSNELVMHVLELKNKGPKPFNTPIATQFQTTLLKLQPLLEKHHLRLLPTAVHPWMDPKQETVRWPHGGSDIYQQYDRIFNCKGHGWANLQSMHLNLSYANQEEFSILHNLIRILLPLLPAIAASSPFIEGKITGVLNSRLSYYKQNQQKIPSIMGSLIPEFICSEEEYQEKILNPMYRDIAPFDPEGILQNPWLNSRAAIPKFDVGAIEIRILDPQECVTADLCIAKAIHAILTHWQNSSRYFLDKPYATTPLKQLLDEAIVKGLSVEVDDRELLTQWQLRPAKQSLRQIWSTLIEQVSSALNAKEQLALELILSQGSLSERLLKASGPKPSQKRLQELYKTLSLCLLQNEQFQS
jgi:gamma-glutamyl:cysteine ligase YbdK (ATP-grasp superfamily)